MPLIPNHDPRPPSYAKDKEAIWREIRALWQLNRQARVSTAGAQGSSGAASGLSDAIPKPVVYTVEEVVAGTGSAASRDDHTHQSVQFAYDYIVVT